MTVNKKISIACLTATAIVVAAIAVYYRPTPRPHFDSVDEIDAALTGKPITEAYKALGEPTTRGRSDVPGEKEILHYRGILTDPVFVHIGVDDTVTQVQTMQSLADRARLQ
jgi:hypothetical protein